VDDMKVKIHEKLDNINALILQLKNFSNEVGAIASFIGVVRESRGKEKVLKMDYEFHPTLAYEIIEKIIEDLKVKYEIIDAVVEHRVGKVLVGEDIMYVLVASKHRGAAFKALKELVERIKNEAPIWKKEITEKGVYWIKKNLENGKFTV
jgi:molybdopterin synthase catalytic subunit